MSSYPISPAEMMKWVVEEYTSRDICPHVVVGGLSQSEQEAGGVALMDAGNGTVEKYLPLVRPRVQLRCIAPSLAQVEVITRHVGDALTNVPPRIAAFQASTDEHYLLHYVMVSGGPSMHWDTEETWEGLLFADTMFSTTPIP